jgi:double-strand break repair protein MRE11
VEKAKFLQIFGSHSFLDVVLVRDQTVFGWCLSSNAQDSLKSEPPLVVQEEEEEVNGAEDILKILVATDLHVGFMEKDPVRGEDSFITLEEILKTGSEQNVDFVLLAGDLFHENKPSRRCIIKVMDLFRRYSLGAGGVRFRIVSDQGVNFPFP